MYRRLDAKNFIDKFHRQQKFAGGMGERLNCSIAEQMVIVYAF